MNTYDWLVNLPINDADLACRVIEVSFNQGSRKDFYRNNSLQQYEKGEMISVEGVSGFDLGDLKNGRAVFTVVTHKSVKATFVYVPTNHGWGAAATEAKKSASKPAVKTAPVVCNGQPEYEYVYSGCAG